MRRALDIALTSAGIGVGIFVIQSVAVLALVVATIFNLFAGLLWARTKRAKAERAVPVGEKPAVASGDADSDQTMREVEGGDGFGGAGMAQRRPLDADLETATLYDVPAAQPTTGDKPIDFADRTGEQHPSALVAPAQADHVSASASPHPTYESTPHEASATMASSQPSHAPALQQPSALTAEPYPTYEAAPHPLSGDHAPDPRQAYY